MKFKFLLLLCATGLSLPLLAEPQQSEFFTDWPAGASPAEVGKRVAENFVPRKFILERNPKAEHKGLVYQEAIAWYGSLGYAKLTDESAPIKALASNTTTTAAA